MLRVIKNSTSPDGYWYLFRHGSGPGTIPKDVTILEYCDHPTNKWKFYGKLDRFLTTKELQEYDLKEEMPPVECRTDIDAATEYDFWLNYYNSIPVYVIAQRLHIDVEDLIADMNHIGEPYGLKFRGFLTVKVRYAAEFDDDYEELTVWTDKSNKKVVAQVVGDHINEVILEDVKEEE